MKHVYALLGALALFAGCGAVQTQSSTSHDIAQMMAETQRGVDLSMEMGMNVGSGDATDRETAVAQFSEYMIAENRVENGIDNTDIALVDNVS